MFCCKSLKKNPLAKFQVFFISACVLLLFPLSSGAATVIACIGNSITEYYYPQELQKLLGNTYSVRDFGESGRCLIRDVDTSYWNSPDYTAARSSNPNIVIIKLGTNDSKVLNWVKKDNYYTDLRNMALVFSSLSSKPKIFLARPLPAYTNDLGIRGDIIHNEIVPLVDSVGQFLKVTVIDCHTPFLDHPELFKDGVHPTPEGYKKLAGIMYDALTATSVTLAPIGNKPRVISGYNQISIMPFRAESAVSAIVSSPAADGIRGRLLDLRGRIAGATVQVP